jgi:DNA sulfur modification protein DndE
MIENVRISEKAKNQLITLKRRTGIQNWNTLCRWGLVHLACRRHKAAVRAYTI